MSETVVENNEVQEITSVVFMEQTYTKDILRDLSQEDLLALRNIVASNLGIPSAKKFKDEAQGVDQTWKVLVKYEEQDVGIPDETRTKMSAAKKPKKEKVPKDPQVVKAALPRPLSAVTDRQLRQIIKIQGRKPDKVLERWENYKDGMTIADVIEGPDMCMEDVNWYVREGYMEFYTPTPEELQDAREKWYAQRGMVDPIAEQREKKELAAKKKELDRLDREKQKQLREEAKALRDAEKKKAKEEKEAKKEIEAKFARLNKGKEADAA